MFFQIESEVLMLDKEMLQKEIEILKIAYKEEKDSNGVTMAQYFR